MHATFKGSHIQKRGVPEQNGSIKRSKTSSPRLRLTNSSTDSSWPCYLPQNLKDKNTRSIMQENQNKTQQKKRWGQTGGGGRRPTAPKPALSFPGKLIKSKNGKSAGLEGTGLSLPFHNTKRGAFGSPKTNSSFNPLSTCHLKFLITNNFNADQTEPLRKLKRRKRNKQRWTHRHGEHGVGGLEAVGAFFPEIAIPFDGGDVSSHTLSGFRHHYIGVTVLRGQGLRDTQATDASPDDHAV